MGPGQEKPLRMTPCCLGNRTAGLAFPTAGRREEAGCGVPGAGGAGAGGVTKGSDNGAERRARGEGTVSYSQNGSEHLPRAAMSQALSSELPADHLTETPFYR